MYKPLFFKMQEATEGQDTSGGFSAEELQRLEAPAGTYDEPMKVEKTAEETTEDTVETVYTPSPLWDSFKDLEGFKMPEKITAETENDLLRPFVAQKFGLEKPVLHPLAQQIQDLTATNPNLTINDLVTNVSEQYVDASKFSIDEKIAFDLKTRYGIYDSEKNPSGLTDDDILQEIGRMTKIQKQDAALVIDENIKNYNDNLVKEYKENQSATYEAQYNQMLSETKSELNTLKESLSKVDSIYGIPVNQETHDQFLAEFERVVIPNKETGERLIDDILSDNMTLYKMFVMVAKFGEEKVIETITKGREGGKEALLKSLSITPNFSGVGARKTGQSLDFESELRLLEQSEK